MIISYDKQYKKQILNAFNLDVKDNLVVDKSTGSIIKDNLGTELGVKRFGGIRKGSLEFINKDVASLLRLRAKLNNEI